MIVRNLTDPEVLETTYIAHGGGIAQMVLDQRVLRDIGFLAVARLAAGKILESHRDPMEEIYYIQEGEGEMTVDEEPRAVKPGDAIWIPTGASHALRNTGKGDLVILVVASPVL